MDDQLRRRMRPADRRLLMGYGPAAVIGAGFLAMALLVPTGAPEQNVASAGSGFSAPSAVGIGTGTAAGAPTVGASGGQQVAGGNAVPVTSGGAAAGNPTPRSSSAGSPAAGSPVAGAGSSPATGVTGGSGTPASVSGCAGPQVPHDPYSPPCARFSGANGGATSRGVSSKTITVAFRISSDDILGVDSLVNRIAGKSTSSQFQENDADVERTVQDLATYFNDHFQFYGRRIVVKFFKGQGQLLNEFQDAGQAQANADALTVADQMQAFSEMFAISQPYAEALSAQHIVNIGTVFMSQQWFQQHAPYAYSFFPTCTDLGAEGAAVAAQEIAAANVTWAGNGVKDGQPRRIAVISPDNPVYQQCFSQIAQALTRSGHAPVANLTYTLSLTQLSQEMSSIAQQLINDKVTTVITATDPIAPVFLSGDLDNAGYLPEIFNIGAAFSDFDFVTQLFDQSYAAHEAGVTNAGATPPFGSSLAYFAAKSVDPGATPAREVDSYYELLYLLALGIQGAGPDLTPQTFQQGLFDYKGGDGEYGPWSFDVGGSVAWTPVHQFRFEWWNPLIASPYNNQKGAWVIKPNWYTPATVPAGPPPVFPDGPQ